MNVLSIQLMNLLFLVQMGTVAVPEEPGTEKTTAPEAKQIVSTKAVSYYTPDGKPVNGYLAVPMDKGTGPWPGIILIHEWWGLNDDIRTKAVEFARDGYVALAVDLYDGQSATESSKARELASTVRQNMPVAFSNLQAAITFLKKDARVQKDRLASIGWCFGGGWSYQIAKNNLGVKASVIYYGRFNPEDDLKKMRAEIIGHFAEKDRSITIDAVKEFQARLKTVNGDHEIYIYPNTTHGFASREGENPNYNKKAAHLAHQRTIDFLKKNL
jgi:carboxymethylenebutenolidase